LLEEVVAARPGAARSKKDLAGYYNHLARVVAPHGNPLQTSDAIARCLVLWLDLADQTPDDPDVFKGLSISLNNLMFTEGFRGSGVNQVRWIRQAVGFAHAALRLHPNDGEMLRGVSLFTCNLAMCLGDQGKREEAVEELQGVIPFLEQGARANPAVSGALLGYGMTAERLARYLRGWDRRDEAAGVLLKAFALAETLARENPEAAASRKNLIDTASMAAAGLKDLGRPDEAIRCLMTGRAALDRAPRETRDSLVQDATSRLQFAGLMTLCKPELAADERAAREGLLDQALASLRRAAAAGWRDAAALKAAPIYQPIRGRAEYPALLAAVEAAARAPVPVAAGDRPADRDRPRPTAAVARSQEIRLARARILASIGQVQAATGRSERALGYLRQALPLQQQLVAEQPADVQRREDLAEIQLALGKTLADLGRADPAIAAMEAARGLYEALEGVSRDQAQFRDERVATLMALGRAYSEANRPGDSLAAWDRAQGELTRAIEEHPDDPRRWTDRALCSIRRRQEPLAACDLWRAWSLAPQAGDSNLMVLWASVVLFNGDREEYRRGCRRLLEPFGQTRNRLSWLHLAIALGLGEDAVDDWSRVVRMTQAAVAEYPIKASYLYHDVALVCLRAGRFEAALRALDESDRLGASWPARTLNDPVRAIACHRLGRRAEARSALEKAREWTNQNEKKGPPDVTYTLDSVGNWYRHMILCREAEALIVYDPIFPDDPFAR
jgi:tetratricopeptide (TPR) repeat protein